MKELLSVLVLVILVAAVPSRVWRDFGALLLFCALLALVGLVNGYSPR